ncbi:cell division protein DivIC [Amphibacillus marinus]|uniref:Cell division protein DivIC n=1 Tax=Amphibacillus marinus TaxID=872970 RepID=A0A1H8TLP3_9BACI|nr:septum formation initiator family protein [Amphibacillus marinus]SEO91892.1 cell division protein DivIC [Amphibacillus marinus]
MGRHQQKVARFRSKTMDQYDIKQERARRKKQRLRRRLILFAVLALVTFSTVFSYHRNQRAIHAEKVAEYEALKNQMVQLEGEARSLSEEISLLEDESYVLRIAKTNYFFTEEGEIVFKLTEEDPAY